MKYSSDYLIEQKKNLARLSPAGHAFYCSNGIWKPAKHLLVLNEYLIKLSLREYSFLIVSMPPQHGKSTLMSLYLPSWYLGTHAEHRVILAGYGLEPAEEWGSKVKQNIDENGEELFGIRLKEDTKRKSFWRIKDHRGSMASVGIGGPITGKSAELFLIDDPIKNMEEANSKAFRNKNWDWFKSVAYTRRQPNSIYAIVMTRWHKDDLVGRLLKEFKAEDIKVLNLEAVCDNEDDPLGREKGEVLWPERYNPDMYKDFKDNLGPYIWNSLYQGKPSDPEGSIFKEQWFRYFTEDDDHYILDDDRTFKKEDCYIIQTIDPAATKNTKSDYFVLLTVAVTPEKDMLIVDVFRGKIGSDEYEKTIEKYYFLYEPKKIGVENKTFGLTIIQQLKKEYPLTPCIADQDKVSRSMITQVRYSVGCVFHKLNKNKSKPKYIEEYEQELKDFPTGEHDDQVDCVSYAGIMVMNKKTPGLE